MNNTTSNLPTAHLANEFAIKGNFNFNSAKEWIVFLYLVGQLNPLHPNAKIEKMVIPIFYLKNILQPDKKTGAFYQRIKLLLKNLVTSYCEFETDICIEEKTLPRLLPIFQEIGVEETEEGIRSIVFEFNQKMKPVLLGLKKNFLSIKPPVNLSSSYAINFLVYAKAKRDSCRKHDGMTTVIRFSLIELKKRLNIQGKYKDVKDFKKFVVSQIEKNINQSQIIKISNIEYEKTGRKITHILFFIQDCISLSQTKPPISFNTEPTTAEIEALSYAQKRAVKFLVKKGIYEGIAIRKIIPMMPSSLCEGYEDYFCEEIYQIVEEKSKAKNAKGRAAILVDWFKKGIFKNDHFSRIIENVHSRKKKLSEVQSMNREKAKNMTATEFVDWTKTQKTQNEDNSYPSPKGAQSMGQIIKEKYRTE